MSRTVRVGVCDSCGAKTLHGLDEDYAGLEVVLDHSPVDPVGEALAVLTGRRTYDLRPTGGRSHGREMAERSAHRIAQGTPPCPVHATHRCDAPLPQPGQTAAATTWPEEVAF